MEKTITFRNIEVFDTLILSKNLKRIHFTGEDLHDFPEDFEGGYVKLILEEDKDKIEGRPKMRSYTVASFDKEKRVLTIDLMINHHNGHTSQWALEAKKGDKAVIAGPGPRKLTDFDSDSYVMFGDLTSINAVIASAWKVKDTAKGEAYLFISDLSDAFDVDLPKNFTLKWLEADQSDYFAVAASKSEILNTNTVIFAGGEAKRIQSLRQYLVNTKEIPSENIYVSGYWREGLDDEAYRAEKRKYS